MNIYAIICIVCAFVCFLLAGLGWKPSDNSRISFYPLGWAFVALAWLFAHGSFGLLLR